MKFLNKENKEYKWKKVGAMWLNMDNKRIKSVTITFIDDVEILKTDKVKGFRHDNAGMGVEKNNKPMLNKDGKQYTYPDFNLFVPADNVKE